MMFGAQLDTKFAKFVEQEQEKATNPNRGIRLVNLAAASFFFYFAFYDLLTTIGNGSASAFTIPGDILALGYGCLNLAYHYKAQPIGIHLILLYVVSILFYTAYLNMFIFQLIVFELTSWGNRSVYVNSAVPIYLVCVRLISCTVCIVTFLILRHADVKQRKL